MAPSKSQAAAADETVKGTRVSSRTRNPSAKAIEAAQAKTFTTITSKSVKSTKTKKESAKSITSKAKGNANKSTKAATKSKVTKSKLNSKSTTQKAATKKTAANKRLTNDDSDNEDLSTEEEKTTKKSKTGTTTNLNKRKRGTTNDDLLEDQENPKKKSRATTTKKTATTKKTSTTKKTTTAKKGTKTPVSRKKPSVSATESESEAQPQPKTRPAALKKSIDINFAPTQKLQIFVFGENGSGELGIGHLNLPGKRVIDVKRPRLNPKLSPEEVGVVQIACGGMHVVALTHDNKILTWGVNDQGTLGRSTKGADKFKSVDENGNEIAAPADDPNDSGLNPLESAPGEIDYINVPEETIFTKVSAGDSVTMAITSTGLVYGCGTFRSNDGVLGFTKEAKEQHTFTQVPGLKNIIDICCGSNHVLALDNKGKVYAFGSGQQNQLGRRIVERTKLNSLSPTPLNIPRSKVVKIFTGPYHSFAIDDKDRVWAWGLNSFGQTGLSDQAGSDGGAIMVPTLVDNLSGQGIKEISAGSTHSIAINGKNEVISWGRADGSQMGLDVDDIPEKNFLVDEDGKVNKRLVLVPTVVGGEIKKGGVSVVASGDTSIAVCSDGKAYSWGFSINYQTGQGVTDDVEDATVIDNSAVRDEKLIWCGLGGQFGILTAAAVDKNGVEAPKINGFGFFPTK